MTTRPAASGSRRQPLISRITSRKNAATSAPETSSNATFAPTCGRSTGPGSGGTRMPRSVSSARSDHGRLDEEDRLPAEQLRENAARRGAERYTDHAGEGPDAGGRYVAARHAGQQGERTADDRGAGRALDRAGGDEQPERRGERADERCRCEDNDAGAEDPSRTATREEGRRQSCEREREVVRRQRPGECGDLDVVASEDLRQRERDDGRVGQDEADRQPEQTDTGACLRAVLLSCRSCRPDPATSRRCRHSRTRRAAPRPSRST